MCSSDLETRNDEFGQLFNAYNQMAEDVQTRSAKDRGKGGDGAAHSSDGTPLKAVEVSATDTEATLVTTTIRGASSRETSS